MNRDTPSAFRVHPSTRQPILEKGNFGADTLIDVLAQQVVGAARVLAVQSFLCEGMPLATGLSGRKRSSPFRLGDHQK
jgi:hypothetical protein